MGWASAGWTIFDPVAKALTDANVPDEAVTDALVTVIRALQDGDWDTERDHLDAWVDHPAVVAAFARCGVVR